MHFALRIFLFWICLINCSIVKGETQPNIQDPGPQMPTYPTNTGTLPQGRAYLEFAPFNYEGSSRSEVGQYYTQFLAHVGATDHLELRMYGSGWTWSEGPRDRTSFSPLSFSAVYGFWGEQEEISWAPAFAVEAFINTEWLGNGETNSGTHPGIQFAFSKDIPLVDTNLNISLGPVRSSHDVSFTGLLYNQEHWDFLFQWALQKEIIKKNLSVYAHGFYNGTAAVSIPNEGSDQSYLYGIGKTVIGGGFIWTVNERLSLFSQVSGGTNVNSPSIVTWSGFAIAF
jgi:hypothetical protein